MKYFLKIHTHFFGRSGHSTVMWMVSRECFLRTTYNSIACACIFIAHNTEAVRWKIILHAAAVRIVLNAIIVSQLRSCGGKRGGIARWFASVGVVLAQSVYLPSPQSRAFSLRVPSRLAMALDVDNSGRQNASMTVSQMPISLILHIRNRFGFRFPWFQI